MPEDSRVSAVLSDTPPLPSSPPLDKGRTKEGLLIAFQNVLTPC